MTILKKLTILLVLALVSIGVTAQNAVDAKKPNDDELKTFVTIVQQLQIIDQQAQKDMVKAIEAEELDVKRFVAIQRAEADAKQDAQAGEEEMQKYNAANKKVAKIRSNAQSKIQQHIQSSDLTFKRYQSISKQVQNDPNLTQKVKQMMQSPMGK
ncbi:MAG TPA: DUF4168 domain-containing protein [Salinivirga sp.]|uniref:DUF4168 domain-containing protein n=1 Tax=Salinivirga sp. TaxID=1970192 RepID=UPI002B460F12|nr:DUF4168 domain-containing protein [Salinivirga sp.]HKK60206.1 DUF4168 domain-containing protein [Salinivirga sp.]